MSSFKFKPEDFFMITTEPDEDDYVKIVGHLAPLVADKANTLLEKHLATLPRVYGRVDDGIVNSIWIRDNEFATTHQALLWDVREIKND